MAHATGSGRARTGRPEPATRSVGGSRNGRSALKAASAPSRRPTTSFLAGLGIGLAVGAAAALLLAPRTGADLRQALRSRGKRVRNKASDAWDDLRLELIRTSRALKRKRRDAKLGVDAAVEAVKPD